MNFDWKHLLRTKLSQKSFLETFYNSNKGTRKVKDFQKLSDKGMYFILQSNITKYNKPFKFISFLFNSNFLEEHRIFSPEIWSKTFTDWFKNALMDVYFLIPHHIEGATHQTFCVPDVENSLSVILSLYCS